MQSYRCNGTVPLSNQGCFYERSKPGRKGGWSVVGYGYDEGGAAIMQLPEWVREAIEQFDAPETGKVEIVLERYQGGVTKIEIGGKVRIKASGRPQLES